MYPFILKIKKISGILKLKKYSETEATMLAAATDKQKESLEKYMKKIKDIKLRVPEEYLDPIKQHAKAKGMSVNQLIISLLEKDMGIDIVTIREQNKQNKENDE